MWIIWIAPNGEIERAELESGISPTPGAQADGRFLQYVDLQGKNISIDQFLETRYYSYEQGGFVVREPRPNTAATWNSETFEWEWDTEDLLNLIRLDRKVLLFNTDWACTTDAPITEEQRQEVHTYRQALRDLPSTLDMSVIRRVEDVTWPSLPSWI
jgi:hypothetical protein